MTVVNNGVTNTAGLQIATRRVYSSTGQIVDMPAIDAISAVQRFPAQWSFSPFSGQPTDFHRAGIGGPVIFDGSAP